MATETIHSKTKILLADDDITTRLLVRASIARWNFTVIEAGDGQEALSIMEAEDPPEIVILDWIMPKLDGLAICEHVIQSKKARPFIIMLTHNKGTANLVKAIESGADAFIEKPVNLEELRCKLIVAHRVINNEYITIL